ncbi:response regulator [Devosia sp. RR2S18]|uniref:response regulator n=1 Tax=Devosia rhizosphaerae TaxID=3049774 RepID=UPI002540FE47|nr:response regulator [Devosia sp. RR2S18]WIJ23813.1 response regulator [Devosia sp. RR2S18]
MKERIPTVLVAEDEPLLALNIEMALEDAGFNVVTANSGDAAIELLEAKPQRFSAVLTDIRMPGKADGWDVGRRARELLPTVAVLYVSGDSARMWWSKGVPGSTMLSKPFPLHSAVDFLEQHI